MSRPYLLLSFSRTYLEFQRHVPVFCLDQGRSNRGLTEALKMSNGRARAFADASSDCAADSPGLPTLADLTGSWCDAFASSRVCFNDFRSSRFRRDSQTKTKKQSLPSRRQNTGWCFARRRAGRKWHGATGTHGMSRTSCYDCARPPAALLLLAPSGESERSNRRFGSHGFDRSRVLR